MFLLTRAPSPEAVTPIEIMFRRAGASFHFIRRNIHNQAATFKTQQRLRPSVLVTSTILAGAVLLYQMRTIQSDAEVEKVSKMSEGNGDILGKATVPSEDIVVPEPEALHGLAWGSNECVRSVFLLLQCPKIDG